MKPDWLWDCIRCGRKLPFDSYFFDPVSEYQDSGTKIEKMNGKRVEEGAGLSETGPSLSRALLKKKKSLGRSIPKEQLDGESVSSAQSSITVPVRNLDSESRNSTPCTCEHSSAAIIQHSEAHTNHKEHELASSSMLPKPSTPLNELSHNSPTRKLSFVSGTKLSEVPNKEASPADLEDRESLSTAISSLLAHHQRENKKDSSTVPSFETSKFGRRKHQLLGRAPSNLSARSISLSRASSVDTMNTDGLGTPIEPINSATSLKFPEVKNANSTEMECKNSITASVLEAFGSQAEGQGEDGKETLQMTQLGYEDPEALVWREKLMRKMGAGYQGLGIEKTKGIGTVKDLVGLGAAPQSISRRTRRAGGR